MQGPRKSIHLFDLDDTLIRTDARVLVRDTQGFLVRALAPAEFTVYRPASGEVFDFREFSDLGILSRGILVKYTKTIIDTILKYGTQSEFGILTARADKKLHAPFLIRLFRSIFGVRLSNELIFAVSDSRFSVYKDRVLPPGSPPFSTLSVSQRKAMVIAGDLVGRGFNDISFYDDSRENLDSFKVMRQAFPHVTYKPHFIDPTWKARLGEFWESGSESKPLIKGANSVRIILEHHSAQPSGGAFPKPGADMHTALQRLMDGTPILLDTVPIWVVCEEGRFFLRRSAGKEEQRI